MPRRTTEFVKERKKTIYELIKAERELPTSEIVKRVGLSHSQVFYILRLLEKEGFIEEIKRGKVAYWRVRS
ncbi:MAG: DNA-binding protein [Thermoprotei archaeon]|nr:MAG: DNA-binding protein [Thermoprotei archaeon]RLF01082.1 MAG: DNA-binding protein [Thermoprotei archaeon]HDI74351.1 winged helix-turn-helix transcriptional regulator [Thermoprotei archaeon]